MNLIKKTLGIKKNETGNTLIIPDLHSPFIKKKFLEFCIETYKKWDCDSVIFLGDIIDNHYSSFHDSDPDGNSAGNELEMAIGDLKKWHKAFPQAKVCLGNHDNIPDRKAFAAGISKKWVKSVGEILEFDGWEYAEEWVVDGILYTHGTGRKCRQRVKQDFMSIVQGHYHSESYIEYFVGKNFKIFAFQLGSGIDINSYAMAYGKTFAKPHINCGVMLDNGKQPILEYMKM